MCSYGTHLLLHLQSNYRQLENRNAQHLEDTYLCKHLTQLYNGLDQALN